ncbi:MAG: ABC transporter permease [Ruoffia tabacinasalis]|uniref:ABC transporter permease n=1 Tax=Ruoffia tabacinasalis TaxID=87458 RepID=A0A5R9EGC9_9LACT|nr:ABC transporter permease [Ruoffia tabacinasalis]TLQ49464.1 ABC transporter permease [Ruoffia tabacinasalis]
MNKRASLLSLLMGVLLLFIWELSAQQVSELILPRPLAVFSVLWKGILDGYFLPHILTTVVELIIGLLMGGFLGVLLGIIIGESPFLKNVFSVYIVISQAIPKIALAPLFMLWFGYGMMSKIVITALICFFPLLEATASAIQHVNSDQLTLFRLMNASRWQTLWYLKFPAGLPTIVQGLRVAVVLSLVGALVGEFIGAKQGLGALIIASQGMMDTTLMFAVLILLAILGCILYGLVNILENLLWYSKENKNEKN